MRATTKDNRDEDRPAFTPGARLPQAEDGDRRELLGAGREREGREEVNATMAVSRSRRAHWPHLRTSGSRGARELGSVRRGERRRAPRDPRKAASEASAGKNTATVCETE
jgi:hypothetical protein